VSPNGKIDLTMLPRATESNLLETMAGEAPATPIEETLLAMVRELLEREAVSADDNFFLVGGHSLLGMQLLVRVRQLYDVDLTLRELFASPTVRRMATIVEEKLIAAIALMSDEDAECQLAISPRIWIDRGSPS
jgi:acyl carrier protein